MAVSIVWYDAAGTRQAVSRMPDLIDIPAGARAPLRIDVELPPSQWAKWVPVLEIPAKGGHDILIHTANIYPTQPPEPETSVLTWPGQWWTNTGKQSGTDLTVPAGGIFVPWATQATPVKSGNWEVVFTYTAASPSRVSVAHNKFKEADETKQTGQSRIGDFDLPAGSNVAKAIRFTIPTAPDPLWTPQFQMPADSPDVTFHKIEVHEYTPDPNAEPPAPGGGESRGSVVAVDPQRYPEFYDPNVTAGSFDSLDATHVAAFANSGLQLGDEVTVTGPTGSVTATVSAIADSKGIVGTLYTTPQLAAAVGSWSTRTTGDPEQVLASPLGVFVHVRDGADIDAVKSEIQRIIAPTYVFEVVDAGELSDQVGQRADTMLAVLYALLGLSLVIAVLGIVNTLVLSVSERTREIGLMRAVGLGRAQVSGEIICESVLTAVYGTVLGGGVGVLLAGALRSVLADQGLARLVIPWSQLAVMLASAIVVGVLAALWPAARAVRLPVLEAIASE